MSEKDQRVVVKAETVKRWIKNTMDEATIKVGGVPVGPRSGDKREPSDDVDADTNVGLRKANANRRMAPYSGAEEDRPAPRSTTSIVGQTGQQLTQIANDLKDRIKVGDYTYRAARDPEYKELLSARKMIASLSKDMAALETEIKQGFERRKAGENVGDLKPQIEKYKTLKSRLEKYKADEARMAASEQELMKHREEYDASTDPEFTEEDLPIGSRKIGSESGIALDTKKSIDKIQLAQKFPEYVIQMFMRAAADYRDLLKEPLSIIKMALRDYANDLKEDVPSNVAAEIGLDPDDINLSKQEQAELRQYLQSDEGQAALASSPEFASYLERWKQGTYQSPHGGPSHKGAPNNISRKLNPGGNIPPDRLESALRLVKKLGTFNVDDDTPSKFDMASHFGLSTIYDPEVSRVDAFLMTDPTFRYFVEEDGYYWDWVRNHAEKAGHKSQF